MRAFALVDALKRIPDVEVTGAITGNGIYDDIGTLIGSVSLHDKVIVDLDFATVWDLTGLNSGTVTTGAFSAVAFSGIEKKRNGLPCRRSSTPSPVSTRPIAVHANPSTTESSSAARSS